MARTNNVDQVHRSSLLRAANLVKPALARAEYVPAYTHIRFGDKRMLAHDDIMAIQIRYEGNAIQRCLPGGLLIRTLSSFSSETVGFKFDEKTQTLTVSSGRSGVKLPTLPAAEFPFDMPEANGDVIGLTKEILEGIERCLPAAGTNDKFPNEMGVTMEVSPNGNANIYSTDSATISMYSTQSKIGQAGDPPVLLPVAFCEQLLSLVKAYPDEKADPALVIMDGALMAEFGSEKDPIARLFHKTLVDVQPLAFSKIVAKYCDPDRVDKKSLEIPDSFDAAFGRALMVQESAPVKTTSVELVNDEIQLHSSTDYGDSDEQIGCKGVVAASKFKIDPALVARALKWCNRISFNDKVVVMGDGKKFLHIVAHA